MFTAAALTLFLIACLGQNISVGPVTIYTLSLSIAQGRKAGIIATLGGTTGRLVHTVAAALGLSALLTSSSLAFGVVKYAGACYLLVEGIRVMRKDTSMLGSAEVKTRSSSQLFFQGFLVTTLNPGIALFFLSFLPQFVNPHAGSSFVQFLVLGTIFTFTGTVYMCGLALLAGSIGNWFTANPRYIRGQKWLTGLILVGLGLRAALVHR